MAKIVEIKLPEEFLLKISKLGSDFDYAAEEILKAGGEVALDTVKSKLDQVVGSKTKEPSRSTGELKRSLGVSPVKLGNDGNHNIKVGFSEPRSDGKSNAMLANVIEYGKHGQPAKPFIKPAKTASKKACAAAMEAKFDEVVKKL